MAGQFTKRIEDLASIYEAVSSSNSNGTFGHFLRSDLTKEVLRKCNLTAVDMRYVTLDQGTQLYSFDGQWQQDIIAHLYSTRFDDPMPKVPDLGAVDETSCARLFATETPLRVLSVQRNSMLELCKTWVQGHYETGGGAANNALNGEESMTAEESTEVLSAMPSNIFQRKDGLSFLDFALFRECNSDFHSVAGVAFDDAVPPPNPTSRHILLFGTEALCLLQELVYPSKKKLRKSADGFMSVVSEPSRPQAPPMKRGRSINTPPVGSHSPAGPPPPPPYQPKTSPHPSPRPGTPTLADDKLEGKSPSKPQAAPREATLPREAVPIKSPPPAKDMPHEDTPKEVETNTQM
ncbi:actin cytoskeleton-regulatory complex protein PAN1-like [Acanthaster planci]|uniref:Actin cytoskeleton-regulatory complex protein PAN1-like n=1 Tax=Acanthaster planci TaxID=133434 RepID=A0A8B7YL99_ACAPL|nr:actin cytoskeleton-regulatory complex protein PAN1-like [Acanthaster planci]